MPHLRIALLTAAALLCTAPARGGLFEDLYRGLDVFATPSGYPITAVDGGGRSNGARFGRLRIVPNEFGEGYRLELDRTFGVDSRGRPEVFDFGNYELELSGATQATLQYTGRGILTGNADVYASNLSYALRGKSGGQDIELSGVVNVDQQLEVNQLGFYTLQLEINNVNSSLVAEGLAVDGELDADFDIGPISIRGNVFYDAAVALLAGIGVDTTELEGVFPTSPIDRITDEIEAALREQGVVLGQSVYGDLEQGTFSSATALEAEQFVGDVIRALDYVDASGPPPGPLQVPAPAGLLLLGLPALVGFRRR